MTESAFGPPRVEEVAPGAFAYVQPDGGWWVNNTGFVVADDKVLSIDTCATERRTLDYLASIASTTGTAVRRIVNTHHHGDHTNGNSFVRDATIIGHTRCRRAMLAIGKRDLIPAFPDVTWGDWSLCPPTIGVHDRLDLWVGDTAVQVHAFGAPAHTDNDVVVWLPAERVLYTGDLVFHGGTPFALMGSIPGWIDALDWLRRFGATVVVPGHGDVTTPAVFDEVESYLRFVWDAATDARAAGIEPLEAARSLNLGRFANWTDPERIVANLQRAFGELDGDPPALTSTDAFAAMSTFLGVPNLVASV
jgi:cyclase